MNPNYNLRILSVDDVEVMRDIIGKMLKGIGFQDVSFAENGQKGLEALEESLKDGKPFDLILCDWNMPVMSGIEFLKKVKQNEDYEEIAFIMVTSESEQEKILDAVSLGLNNYLVKPINVLDLREKIFDVFDFDMSQAKEIDEASFDGQFKEAYQKQKKIESNQK